MGEIKNLVDQSIKQREDALRHSNSFLCIWMSKK